MAGTARERVNERKSSGRCLYRGHREGMLAIGRSFRSRISAFDRPLAAPMAAPAPGRGSTCTVARRQAFACRDCARVRLCRSKPLHESLCASARYQPRRLAATAGNRSEVVNENDRVATRSDLFLNSIRTDQNCFVCTRARAKPPLTSGKLPGYQFGGEYATCAMHRH
jgi:hypothetical protein